MDDDQPSGSCVTCRRRDAREGYACGPCRSRLRSWLSEIPDLWEQLLQGEPLVVDVRPVVEKYSIGEEEVEVVTNRPRDPVAHHLPTGASSSLTRGGPVTGSRDRQIPILVDRFDLTHAGGWPATLDHDQVGYVPVWMTLETWARDWSTFRNMGEAAVRTVPGLCRWMWERVDDMCDEHPGIDEAFGDIRRLHGTLYAQLGMFEKPDYKKGVPCRQCNALALVRHNGSDFVECGECPAVLTPEEYDRWVRAVASAMKKDKAA